MMFGDVMLIFGHSLDKPWSYGRIRVIKKEVKTQHNQREVDNR
jgi:hypothetical protein